MPTKMVLLGKVVNLPKEEIFRGKLESKIVLNVKRNFQNPDGQFSHDVMEVYLWRGIADYIKDVVQIGEKIHVIGRYETDENKNIVLFGEQVDLIR